MTCLTVPDGDPTLGALPVHVEGRGAIAEEQPSMIAFGGGGPIERGAVERFHEALRQVMRSRVSAPPGQAWWSDATTRTCDIGVHYGDTGPLVRARRSTGVLRVHVEQPPSSIDPADPEAQALRVAEQVVELVRRREGLGPHPAFPDV
jgi:hypothetical protein